MGERHDRSVKSTSTTILGYVEEIRSLLSRENGFQANVNGRLSPEDSKDVEVALRNIEEIIKDYWDDAGLQRDDVNVKWKVLILAEFMENLIYDIRPERLRKTHGEMDSTEDAKRLNDLCDDLNGHAQRLKAIVSKDDRDIKSRET